MRYQYFHTSWCWLQASMGDCFTRQGGFAMTEDNPHSHCSLALSLQIQRIIPVTGGLVEEA